MGIATRILSLLQLVLSPPPSHRNPGYLSSELNRRLEDQTPGRAQRCPGDWYAERLFNFVKAGIKGFRMKNNKKFFLLFFLC